MCDFDWDTWHKNYSQKEVISFAVKGVTFKNDDGISRQNLLKKMNTYEAVKLIPEPQNIYDSKAIAVYGRFGQLGYVPQNLSEEIKWILESEDLLIKGTVRRNQDDVLYLIVDIMILKKETYMHDIIVFFENGNVDPRDDYKYIINASQQNILYSPPHSDELIKKEISNITKCELLHLGTALEATLPNGDRTYSYTADQAQEAFNIFCAKHSINTETIDDFKVKIFYEGISTPDTITLGGKVFAGEEIDFASVGATFVFYFYVSVGMHATNKHKQAHNTLENISDTRVCPFCAEEIKKAAILCKHCKSTVSPMP